MTETQIKHDIAEAFRVAGWKVLRVHAGTAHGGRMHFAEAGAPDLVCLGPWGDTLLVEVKREQGTRSALNAAQVEMYNWCLDHWHRYAVMRSVADVEKHL